MIIGKFHDASWDILVVILVSPLRYQESGCKANHRAKLILWKECNRKSSVLRIDNFSSLGISDMSSRIILMSNNESNKLFLKTCFTCYSHQYFPKRGKYFDLRYFKEVKTSPYSTNIFFFANYLTFIKVQYSASAVNK